MDTNGEYMEENRELSCDGKVFEIDVSKPVEGFRRGDSLGSDVRAAFASSHFPVLLEMPGPEGASQLPGPG